MTKSEKAILLFKQGMLKESYAIFKTFRIGFTQHERRCLEIAYESLSSNDSFYRQIGIDTEKEILNSKSIIQNKYGKFVI